MNKHRRFQKMTKRDMVTAEQAIDACATLSTFLTPMIADSARAGELEVYAFMSGLVADLGALRESLRSMVIEDLAA